MTLIDDSIHFRGKFSAVCSRCAHKQDGPYCLAYPEGEGKMIPLAIWRGRNRHTRPYPGDHGVQFQPRERPAIPVAQSEQSG